MWYITKIIIKQNKFFYTQIEGSSKMKIARKCNNAYDRCYENCIDTNEYIFSGNLGECFISYEKKKPEPHECRIVFGEDVIPYKVKKIGYWPFSKYKIQWILKRENTVEKLKELKKKIFLL